MSELSASDVRELVAEVVQEHWKTDFKLCITSTAREEGQWVLEGTLSKPTALVPVPSEVVHALFRVDDAVAGERAVTFRLERYKHWRSGVKGDHVDAWLERVVDEKRHSRSMVPSKIIRDAFGSTRQQLGFGQERAEEAKIDKDNEVPMYSDESDDEYMADDAVFGGAERVPQILHDPEDEARNTKIQIREVVEDEFDAQRTAVDEAGELPYATCVRSMWALGTELKLDQDDLITLYALLRENPATMTVSVEEVRPAIIERLQFRLTHARLAEVKRAWGEAFLRVHSPELDRITDSLLQRVSNHVDFCDGSIPRESLRESLASEGEGLFDTEINAVMAMQQPARLGRGSSAASEAKLSELPPGPQREQLLLQQQQVVHVDDVKLVQQIRDVRLAFVRDVWLRFGTPDAIEQHLLTLVVPPEAEPKEVDNQAPAAVTAVAALEDEGMTLLRSLSNAAGADAQTTRSVVLHRLVCDKSGLVLSKAMALRLLAACPSVSETEDFVVLKVFAQTAARTLVQFLDPRAASRSLALWDASASPAAEMLKGKSRDEFNGELWLALEAAFTDRSPVLSLNAFAEAVTTFLGENTPAALVDTLAAAYTVSEAPQEVRCRGLARGGYDTVLLLAHAFAMQSERAKEEALDTQLAAFRERHGCLRVVQITPVGEPAAEVRLGLLRNTSGNARESKSGGEEAKEEGGEESKDGAEVRPDMEVTLDVATVVAKLGLAGPKVLLSEDAMEDADLLRRLSEAVFVDARNALALHVPLSARMM